MIPLTTSVSLFFSFFFLPPLSFLLFSFSFASIVLFYFYFLTLHCTALAASVELRGLLSIEFLACCYLYYIVGFVMVFGVGV